MEYNRKSYRFFIETIRNGHTHTTSEIVELPHNAWQEQAASCATAFRVFKELEDGCCQNFEDVPREGTPIVVYVKISILNWCTS